MWTGNAVIIVIFPIEEEKSAKMNKDEYKISYKNLDHDEARVLEKMLEWNKGKNNECFYKDIFYFKEDWLCKDSLSSVILSWQRQEMGQFRHWIVNVCCRRERSKSHSCLNLCQFLFHPLYRLPWLDCIITSLSNYSNHFIFHYRSVRSPYLLNEQVVFIWPPFYLFIDTCMSREIFTALDQSRFVHWLCPWFGRMCLCACMTCWLAPDTSYWNGLSWAVVSGAED